MGFLSLHDLRLYYMTQLLKCAYFFYADTLKVSSGALIEVTLLFRYSTTDKEATRVLALFGHLSEWLFN